MKPMVSALRTFVWTTLVTPLYDCHPRRVESSHRLGKRRGRGLHMSGFASGLDRRHTSTRLVRFGSIESCVILLDLAVLTGSGSRVTRPRSWLSCRSLRWLLLISLAGLCLCRQVAAVYLGLDLPLVLGAGFVFGPVVRGQLAFLGVLDIRELASRDELLPGHLQSRSDLAECHGGLGGVRSCRAASWQLARLPWRPGLVALAADRDQLLDGVDLLADQEHPSAPATVARDLRLGSARSFALAYVVLWVLERASGRCLCYGWGIAGVLAFTAPARSSSAGVSPAPHARAG